MRQVVVPTPSGRTALMHVSHIADLIQNHHLNGWWYEAEELAVLAGLFPRGGLFLDVGANVGNHSVYLALERGARCRCVEPNPEVWPALRLNAEANINDGSVIFAGLGAGWEEGRGLRTVHPGNLGGTWIEGEGETLLMPGDELGLAPDLIKIDVEGMELDVLTGLERTISRARPVIFVEVMHDHARALGAWARERGYTLGAPFEPRYAANANYLLLP